MNILNRCGIIMSGVALALAAFVAEAQDWPQWRGGNRDAKADSFKAPKTWPKELTQKWKLEVGDGVATPSLVGDKLYVFARQEGGEILRCLNAADGKELWRDKYDALGASGPASGFSGPRCSPTVADGKVVTLGVRGMLSCLDAAKGTVLWRKDDFKGATPRFQTSASPIVAGGLCVAQLGGGENGSIVAYDFASGDEKWKWVGDSPAYASPVLMTIGSVKYVVAETEKKLLVLALTDGKLAWETPFAVPGRGYNATTPIVDGQTIIYTGSGRGSTAVRLEQEGDALVAKELWKNLDNSVQFNSPVLKGDLIFGISARNDFFCLDAKDGKTAWVAPFSKEPASAEAAGTGTNQPTVATAAETNRIGAVAPPPPGVAQTAAGTNGPRPGGEMDRPREGRGGPGGEGGGRGGRGGGRGGAPSGYGSIVDAGSVLLALTPASQLVAFEPDGKEFKELARIKVADTPTYAYPVVSGNRIFVKDQNFVSLLIVE